MSVKTFRGIVLGLVPWILFGTALVRKIDWLGFLALGIAFAFGLWAFVISVSWRRQTAWRRTGLGTPYPVVIQEEASDFEKALANTQLAMYVLWFTAILLIARFQAP
ncbi:MAG: hypothetical protein AAB601_02585 [Patescibacteria group bacterium]